MFTKNSIVTAAFIVFVCYVTTCESLLDNNDISNLSNAETKNATNTDRNGRSLHNECTHTFSAKCMKIYVLSFIEDLSSRDELSLFQGLSIIKENRSNGISAEEVAAELSRQFPGKPDEKLNRFLVYRLQNYLDGHSLKFRLLDDETSKEALKLANGDKESVARKKDKGGGGLIAAAMMMKGTLAAAALGALALLAGKALMTALMSLLLSALVGLKGGGGHKSTTYEIITKPEVSHHHSHSHEEHHEHEHGHHGGYRRAYEDQYNSYMPYETTTS